MSKSSEIGEEAASGGFGYNADVSEERDRKENYKVKATPGCIIRNRAGLRPRKMYNRHPYYVGLSA